ncbi:MAG: DUF4012 domain-containing protein [Anaerolineae bacterium]|nr:DUF4012 domain-containing protein [Anaerolineae bacterium]
MEHKLMPDLESPSLPDLRNPVEPGVREKRRRRRSRRRWYHRALRRLGRYNWRIFLLMAVTFSAAVVMGGVILAFNARTQVETSWESLDRIQTSLSKKSGADLTLTDFERLHSGVRDLNQSLGSARKQTLFLRPFTFLSSDLVTTFDMLDAAQELTIAADDMLAGLQPALFSLTGGEGDERVTTQFSSGERVVELLSLGRGRFVNAGSHLDAARAVIERLDPSKVSSGLLATVDGLTQAYDELANYHRVLLDSPDLLTAALGLKETQSYLILAQNNDELRPSGGYLSTYGWMTVRNGRITKYDYQPTTTTSPNPPPDTLANQVQIPEWWIQYREPIYAAWDSSWYVDFPSTARMAAWYYDNGGNPNSPVDGVIGIDLVAFEYMLQELGSVYVPDYDVTVSASNFRETVYTIRAASEGHKQFVAAVYRQILGDWQRVDQEKSVEVRGALLKALLEKHIMLYFLDDALNDAVQVLGWQGEQKPALDTDYLLVADANLGNKANRSVKRQFTYDVTIEDDGSLSGSLAIAYDFSERVAELDPAVGPEHGDTNYRSLTQVFVPANSTLTGTEDLSGPPTVVNTDTHTAFVARMGVDYNESERYQFFYTTPPLVEPFGSFYRYRLLVQKQPGTLSEPVSVQLRLPPGAQTVYTDPAPAASYSLEQLVLEFRLSLTSDQTIEVVFTR